MLLKLVNKALQSYLDSDPEIAAKLNEYEGKELLIHLTDVKKEFVIRPQPSSITLSEYNEAEADDIPREFTTIIYSTIVSLIKVSLGSDYQAMMNTQALKIEGDVEFANQLHAIFKEIDIDWEEVASKYVGDSVAYQLGIFANKFKKYSSRSVENFQLDVSEYLQEESRILPTKVEINRFMSDVDEFDAYVQRLHARIQRLEESLES